MCCGGTVHSDEMALTHCRHLTNRGHLQQNGTMRHHSSTLKQEDSSEQKRPSETPTAIQSQVVHNTPENNEICAAMRKCWACLAGTWRGWTLTILPFLPPPMKTLPDTRRLKMVLRSLLPHLNTNCTTKAQQSATENTAQHAPRP